MPKYIEEKELKDWVENWLYKDRWYHNGRVSKNIPIPELYDILEQMPTADVFPVVRCKDCKRWNTAECHSTLIPNFRKCMVMNVFTEPDQFCKYGERRTDNMKNEEVDIHKMIVSLEEIKNVLREAKKR